jgi:hypothetical protein
MSNIIVTSTPKNSTVTTTPKNRITITSGGSGGSLSGVAYLKDIYPIFIHANSSYDTANASYGSVNANWTVMNVVYLTTNSNYNTTNSAYITLNSAYATVNAVYASSNSNWVVQNAIYTLANTIYASSNSNWVVQNAIYTTTNSAYGVANANYAFSNSAYASINAAYATVNAVYASENSNWTVQNAIYTLANTIYASGNSNWVVQNAIYDLANTIYASSNSNWTVQNALYTTTNAAYGVANANYTVSNSAYATINASYASGNSNWVVQNAIYDLANTIYASQNVDFLISNLAYTVANAAYANANSLAIGANAWSNAVGVAGNSYAQQVGAAANSFTNTNYVKYANAGLQVISSDVGISGNLTISGAVTYANTTQLQVGDNIITLNADLPLTIAPIENAGIEVNRGNKNSNAALTWIEAASAWSFTANNQQPITTYIASNTDLGAAYATVNSAYTSVNSNWVVTNSNYAMSNAAYVALNSAFDTVNAVYASGNSNWVVQNALYTLANTIYASSNSNWVVQNAIYDLANTIYAAENSNWTVQNLIYATVNANYTSSNVAYTTLNSAYAVANAVYASQNVDFLISNLAYTVANAAYANANSLAIGANAWSNTVGLSANSYAGAMANSVNVAQYAYSNIVAIGANTWSNTVGFSVNTYASILASNNAVGANNWANTVGIAGNNYTIYVGAASNNWANTITGPSSNSWANTKLSNTTNVWFSGNLNISQDLYIGRNLTNVTQLIFNTSTNQTPTSPGSLTWSQDDSTLHFDSDSPGNVILHIGQDLVYYVKNQTGGTINKGNVCMFAGTLGASGRLTVQRAIANNAYPSKYIMGLASEDILNGADGFVVSQGRIRGINTSMFSQGDILYASPTNLGGLQNTMPTAPNNKVTIAAVIYSDNINGSVYVRPTYGSKINEDELAEINAIADGDLLRYNSANGRFENFNENSTGPAINAVAAFAKANAANLFTFNTAISVNAWANTVGTAGNNYTNFVGTSANSYAGAMANSVNVAHYSYANIIGAASNTWANTVGTAGNNYTNFVGTSANSYAGAMANSVNVAQYVYTNTVAASVNAWSNTVVAAANAWSNTFLSNTSGVSFNGTLNFPVGPIILGPGPTFFSIDNSVSGKYVQFPSATIANYDNGSNNLQLGFYNNSWRDGAGSTRYIRTSYASYHQMDNIGGFKWYTAPSGTANTAATFTTRLSLDNAGNVSIGASATTYKLDVAGTTNIASPTLIVAGSNVLSTIYTGLASGNAWTNTVGTSGNSYTNFVGVSGNSYADQVGAGANSFTNTNYVKYANSGSQLITSDVAISGNLTISGQTTFANTQQLQVGDNIVTLNADLPLTVAPVENAGIEVNRGNKNSNATILWVESSSAWSFTANNQLPISTFIASNTLVETYATAGNNYASILVANNAVGANTWANLKVHTITSNSTSRVWANTVTLGDNTKTIFLDLANSGVTAAQYGGTAGTVYPVVSVDAYGRVTYAAQYSINFNTANSWANGVGTSANSYADQVGAGANSYASIYIANTSLAANTWANTKLANTNGVSFAGDLYFPTGNVGIGISSGLTRLLQVQGNTNSGVKMSIGNSANGTGSFAQYSVDANGSSLYAYSFATNYTTSGRFIGGSGLIESTGAGGLGFASSSATGNITFWTDASTTEKMRIATNGRVGIGTASPTSLLHLYNSVGPVINFDMGTKLINFGMNSSGDFTLNDQTAGTGRIYLLSSGLMGIGNYYGPTYLPKNSLSIAGGVSIGLGITGDVAAPSGGLLVNGNVGIGNTAPGQALDVNGNIKANSYIMANSSLAPITVVTASATDQTIDTFTTTTWRSANYVVTMTSGTDYHTTQISLIHDGTNAYITEYGTISTANNLGLFNATIVAGSVRLNVVPMFATTTINMLRTTNK